MFIGHLAVAFGAKRAASSVSLGTLFVACQLADLVWPALVVAGIERVTVSPGATVVTPLDFVYYPFSHSLVAAVIWSAAFGTAYMLLRRAGAAVGITLGFVVLSHWLLDVVSHRPDMPITFSGDTRIGLGLWQSLGATIAVEGLLFAGGVWLYLRTTRARDRAGTWGLWSLIAFLLMIYAANLLGPPPPSGEAAAWSGFALWLLVAWAYWVDRHRESVATPSVIASGYPVS